MPPTTIPMRQIFCCARDAVGRSINKAPPPPRRVRKLRRFIGGPARAKFPFPSYRPAQTQAQRTSACGRAAAAGGLAETLEIRQAPVRPDRPHEDKLLAYWPPGAPP